MSMTIEQALAFDDARLTRPVTRQERVGTAMIRTALRRPPSSPFPERRAYPFRPLPSLRLYSRAWWRELGAQLRRIVHVAWLERTAPACCLGYRYGHGWSEGDRVQLTHDGGPLRFSWVSRFAGTDDRWLPIVVEHRPRWAPGGVRVTDYVLLLQGPPAPCPTCGTPPPAAAVAAWHAHVARHRAQERRR